MSEPATTSTSSSTTPAKTTQAPATTTESDVAKVTKLEPKKFFMAQEGMRGRDGGPYLDLVEREAAEIQRAKIEGREPDMENLSAVAGTVLVPIGQLADNLYSNPSMSDPDPLAEAMGKAIEDNLPDNVKPVELKIDVATQADVDKANAPA